MLTTTDETTPEKIGARLKLIREVHGLTQAQLCTMLGFRRGDWCRFENGRRAISLDHASRLSDRFKLSLDFIYRGDMASLPYETGVKLTEQADAA